MAKWIWLPGSFELYHSMLLHNRRTSAHRYRNPSSPMAGETRSIYYQPMWVERGPEHNVMLEKEAVLEKEETIEMFSNTADSYICVDDVSYPRNVKIKLSKGHHKVLLSGFKAESFPAFFIKGNVFASDRSYKVFSQIRKGQNAGESALYTNENDVVEIFKFKYKTVKPVSVRKVNRGLLYDFGREQFAKLTFKSSAIKNVTLFLGESEEEALDVDYTHNVVNVELKKGTYSSVAVAFRYVFIPTTKAHTLSAKLEYLPITNRGGFKSANTFVNELWDICAYTMLLNSREGFFDGIKRDRWIWSGDAYQSYLVNYYLGFDKEIVKRTIRALRGGDPIRQHMNTITDYTFFWLISIWDYYFYTGDKEFIQDIYPDMKDVLSFVEGRLSKDGMFERREGDWVFMDWSTFDSDGPMCAEQILLARAYESMSMCAALNNEPKEAARCKNRSNAIKKKVNALYWNEKKGAFVDSYTSGKNNVTRHANILALLFGYTTEEREQSIIKNVIYNKKIIPITTPYFEFFELDSMCKIGDFKYMTDMLDSYWGGMIRLGATTIWEEFDPRKKGVEHYAMYGGKYEKSLCHAWGASPIYLLGKYALGIKPTAPGYEKYEVCPNKMAFIGDFEGKVPCPTGEIFVRVTEEGVTVKSPIDGGTLVLPSGTYKIEKNKELFARW